MSPFKVSRRDLEQHWRAADDRALASAAEQLEEFTEETVEVVQAELRRRSSLNLATPAAAEDTNLGESDGDAAALEELKEYTPRIYTGLAGCLPPVATRGAVWEAPLTIRAQ